VLRGEARFVALGAEAEHVLVVSGDPAGAWLVKRGAQGLSVKTDEGPVARARRSASFAFDGVKVGASDRVGAEGQGRRVADAALDAGRIAVAAHAVGVARGALDHALDHVRERRKTTASADLQAATFALADAATEIDAARLLVHRAALAHDGDVRGASTLARAFAAEMASRVTLRVLPLFGLDAGAAAAAADRHHRAARIAELELPDAETRSARIAHLEATGAWAGAHGGAVDHR
jgi:alkylation response protein AidB-like acyl-CoA dehydrogenase